MLQDWKSQLLQSYKSSKFDRERILATEFQVSMSTVYTALGKNQSKGGTKQTISFVSGQRLDEWHASTQKTMSAVEFPLSTKRKV